MTSKERAGVKTPALVNVWMFVTSPYVLRNVPAGNRDPRGMSISSCRKGRRRRTHTVTATSCILLLLLLPTGCRKADDAGTKSGDKPANNQGWFTEVTRASGILFNHETGATGRQHMPEIMGGGCALADFNGDGKLDAYFVNGNEFLPGYESSQTLGNSLYRQVTEQRFSEVGRAAADGGYGMGVAVGDANNDGRPDLFVTNYGIDQLYLNRGDDFENVTDSYLPKLPGWSASATFLDFDGDGWLDIFVTRYLQYDGAKACTDRAGRPNYCSPQAFLPVTDRLLRNMEGTHFVDVTEAAGLTAIPPAAGLGVIAADFDGDGALDIYVANDGYPNHLWRNKGDGQFVDVAMEWRVAFNDQGRAEAGMGVVAADINNDRHIDLFMTHLTNESNTIYTNQGSGKGFEDRSMKSGLANASMPFTGFGTAAFDVELDGDLDILVANGRVTRSASPPKSEPDKHVPDAFRAFAEPNKLFLQSDDGRFASNDALCGALCGHVEVSRGLATGDIDNDGDLDVLIIQAQGPARLFRNDAPRKGDWVGVRAVIEFGESVRPDLGAVVSLVSGDHPQVRMLTRSTGYLSCSDPVAHFGVKHGLPVSELSVTWTNGKTEYYDPPELNRYITVRRGTGRTSPRRHASP